MIIGVIVVTSLHNSASAHLGTLIHPNDTALPIESCLNVPCIPMLPPSASSCMAHEPNTPLAVPLGLITFLITLNSPTGVGVNGEPTATGMICPLVGSFIVLSLMSIITGANQFVNTLKTTFF